MPTRKRIITLCAIILSFVIAIALVTKYPSRDNLLKANSISANAIVSDGDLLRDGSSLPRTELTTDPDKVRPDFTMLSIGDWGSTISKPGSCCNRYRKTIWGSTEYKKDYWAQSNVAELMATSAEAIGPLAVIGLGDNLYWNGGYKDDFEYRMQNTFEEVYNRKSLQNVVWYNTAGNHDLGGSNYICGDSESSVRPCRDVDDLLFYLNLKFHLQQSYKSPYNDRWVLRDHYYMQTIEKNGTSVDLFVLDTNIADREGATQICCQCYGYSGKQSFVCLTAARGHKYCAGGSLELYDACIKAVNGWWEDSLRKVEKDLMTSEATFRMIATHYSPHFHMDEVKMKRLYRLTKQYNVACYFNGHTHGFNHDISVWGTHFIQNGGGGGTQSETSSIPKGIASKFVKNNWVGKHHPYGFFEILVSKEWLTLRFVTFDVNWVFSTLKDDIVKGGIEREYCYHISINAGEGRVCKGFEHVN